MSKSLLEFKSRAEQPFSIKAKSDTSAEIIFYGTVGGDWFDEGITAKAFSEELKKLSSSVKNLSIRINSPGGSVFEGITIYNRLKQHKSKKTVYIDGLAASIASVIALAGDEIIMGDGAMYMIHLPWTIAMGDRREMENVADLLAGIEEQMIGIYAKASGLDRMEVKKMMEDETWMDAQAAIDFGFVTKMADESLPIAASVMKSKWFRHAPANYKSDTKVIAAGIEELKKKIGAVARK
jgi:ATP-dependent Clp protease protease subunit